MHPFFKDYLALLETSVREIKTAISGLSTEELDWSPGPEMNSMAVLVAHVVGSTRYWVGDVAAGDASDRHRPAEFAVRTLDEAELRRRMDELLAYVSKALSALTLEELAQPRSAPDFKADSVSAGWALLHALEHTATHVGHVQIMRQLLDNQA